MVKYVYCIVHVCTCIYLQCVYISIYYTLCNTSSRPNHRYSLYKQFQEHDVGAAAEEDAKYRDSRPHRARGPSFSSCSITD